MSVQYERAIRREFYTQFGLAAKSGEFEQIRDNLHVIRQDQDNPNVGQFCVMGLAGNVAIVNDPDGGYFWVLDIDDEIEEPPSAENLMGDAAVRLGHRDGHLYGSQEESYEDLYYKGVLVLTNSDDPVNDNNRGSIWRVSEATKERIRAFLRDRFDRLWSSSKGSIGYYGVVRDDMSVEERREQYVKYNLNIEPMTYNDWGMSFDLLGDIILDHVRLEYGDVETTVVDPVEVRVTESVPS